MAANFVQFFLICYEKPRLIQGLDGRERSLYGHRRSI